MEKVKYIKLGEVFESYEEFMEALTSYCNKEFVSFYKREARTIAAAKKKTERYINPKLKYYQLKYACVKGGKKFKSLGSGKRNTSTYKEGCNAHITLRASQCGSKLQIISTETSHNHTVSKQLYDHLPNQRRLPEDIQSEIIHLAKLKTNRKQIKCYIEEKCNKIVLLKDIHNLATKFTKSEAAGMTLQSSIEKLQSKYVLSLFTVVNFNNQQCVGATGENGTCLTGDDCQRRGGTPNGVCAGGFGSCCVFVATCGTTIRENGTYFVNQGYPSQFDGTGSCQITLIKSQADVCQFRLDFDQFQLMGPETTNNMCNSDQFIVSGGTPVPAICGTNMGNHMYIDAGEGVTTSPIILSVVTSGPTYMRNWKIRITQIPCSSTFKAEEGCLQYFTGVAGQIRSFNYDPASGLQLSNQDYSICIRTERNFCGIQYTQCPDTVNNRTQSFTLSGNTNNPIQAMVGSTGSANFCQADFLIIPMAMNVGRPTAGTSPTVDRICGGTLSADVTLIPTTIRSNVKPFRLWFHTDNVENPTDIMNRGFCLNYVQQPCTNAIS